MSRDEMWILKSAPERYPDLFELVEDARSVMADWIDDPNRPDPTDAYGIVAIACTVRTWNTFKATACVLSEGMWEDALILIRSIFEIVLNLEEIRRIKSEQEQRAQRFLRFQEFQEHQQNRKIFEYNIKTGIQQQNQQMLDRFDAHARAHFSEFRIKPRGKGGKARWVKSWCNKTVRELADASDNAPRPAQYDLLYSYCSSFVHATPFAVLSTMTTIPADGTQETWEPQFEKLERANMLHAVTHLIVLSVEVLAFTGPLFPKRDRNLLVRLMDKVHKLRGEKLPDWVR